LHLLSPSFVAFLVISVVHIFNLRIQSIQTHTQLVESHYKNRTNICSMRGDISIYYYPLAGNHISLQLKLCYQLIAPSRLVMFFEYLGIFIFSLYSTWTIYLVGMGSLYGLY